MRLKTLFPAVLLTALSSAAGAQGLSVINVEIDYMSDGRGHSHEPSQLAIDAVVQMFACKGITLNIVVSNAITEISVIQCPNPGTDDFFTTFGPSSFRTLKSVHAGLGNLPGWHYAIFGHDYDDGNGTGSSGIAEIGGDDLLVTLDNFDGLVNGSDFSQAATFAHELGHNLGLRHWSPGSLVTNGPYAPNYASIMSYQYQLSGVRTRMQCLGLISTAHLYKDLDYSNGRLPLQFESILEESVGVGIHRVDWDCDGSLDGGTVNKDLDDERVWCSQGSGVSILDDWNDWANLTDNSESTESDAPLPYETCITWDEHVALTGGLEHLPDPNQCWSNPVQPTLVVESCKPGRMIFVDDSNPGGFLGTGDDPSASIGLGLAIAPDQSVLYLQPGTYTNSGSAIVIDRPITLAGPGGAVVDP